MRIGTGGVATRARELGLKELRRHFADIGKPGPLLLAPRRLGIGRRQTDAGLFGKTFDGLRKAQPFGFTQERKMITGRTAAKTFVAVTAIVDVKTWALFLVKRTARPIVALARLRLAPVPGHTPPDNIRQGQTGTNFIE